DISAPGVDVGSSTSGTNGYHYMTGTSMAAPHVTGVAMLIKTLNPTFTASQITSRLTSTAVDLGPAGKDDTFGYGRLNAAAAVY
ncbi:MAG TPA: S8 family serine peptidase, partial [Candidatus Thermoplasmatota archaeon]|nr:S8 family serine peptidase [Candidatus Thermoplasmatota archaeon]